MEKRFFVTRHSKKPKGEDVESERYKGISKSGVELARQSAQDILSEVEKSPKGAVVLLAGVSDMPRTKSTAEAYGNELKRLLADRTNEYVLITKEDVGRGRGYSAVAREIKQIIDTNPHKKIIINLPMFLKELSMVGNQWITKDGKPTPYVTKLLEKNNGDEYKAIKEWIENQGEMDGLKGPNPLKVAKNYQKGLNRIENFAKKNFGDRPYITGLVGHGGDLDAYLAYVAGEGNLDLSALEKISSGKGLIKETEMATVRIGPEVTTLSYRGREHSRRTRLEDITGAVAIGSLLLSLFSFSGITGNVIGSADKSNLLGFIFAITALLCGLIWVWTKRGR